MTNFEQLGNLTKRAHAAPGYKFQKTPSGLNDPYLPQVAKVKPQSLTNAVGWGVAEMGADAALGSQAFTGVPWYLGKALYQGLKGNWGNAAANVGMAGVTLIPGAGTAAALGKGALTAGRIANVGRVASAVGKYKGGIASAQQAVGGGINAVKALPAVARASGVVGGAVTAAKASQAGQAAARGFDNTRAAVQGFQIGRFNTGAGAWNAAAKTGRGAAFVGKPALQQAPMEYAASKIPNNPNLLPPTAPPPTPANPFSDSQIQSALAGDF